MIAEIRAGNWRRPALLILALSAIAMALILVGVGRGLTFWLDEWDFIFGRQSLSLDSFLRPHVDAFVLVPAAVYYVALHAFGLSSYYPILVADWLAHFVCVGLLALIVSRKSGVLVGLMAGLSLLFLGSAYEALLQPFQMQYLFSAAGGLAALLVLDRDARTGRHLVIAALALLVAIASSGVGPIVTLMIFVWGLLRRDRPAILTTIPALATYGIWYLGWQSHLSRIPGSTENLVRVPMELLYGIGSAVAGVSGLPPLRFAWLGAAIAVAVVFTLVVLMAKRHLRPTPLAVAALVALVVEYGLHAVFRGAMGLDHAARSAYIYPAAIFIWLAVAGTIGRRLEPRRWTGGRKPFLLALIGLLIVPMALANMTQLFLAARALHVIRATEARELTLIERLRDVPGLALNVSPDVPLLGNVTASRYFAAIDRFGAPYIEGASDDVPGPDGAALNAVAVRLLGDAIHVGPDGAPGPSAPSLNVVGGSATADDSSACSLFTPSSDIAVATWSAPSSGVAITSAAEPEQLQLFIGLFEPADAPMPDAISGAVRRGATIWLPTLPESYAWALTLRVAGNVPVRICSKQ